MSFNDSELIEKCCKGDKEAFGKLVEKYKRSIYTFAYQMTHNHEDADDLSQEAFIRAYENLNKFEPGTNFKAWLFRILRNLCIDHLRHTNRFSSESIENTQEQLLTTHNPGPEEKLLISELRQKIFGAIDSLPESQKTVVICREMQGLSHREIAEITQTPEKTVRWRLHQARKKLQKMLKEYL